MLRRGLIWGGVLAVHAGVAWHLAAGPSAAPRVPATPPTLVRLMAAPVPRPAPPLRAPVPLDAALWQRPLAALGPIPPPAVGPVESPTRAGAALDPPRVRTPDASPSTLSPERLPADPVADPVRLPPRVVVQYLEPPVPDYPSLSRRLGETGRVLVRVDIDAEGRTREVALLRSSGYPRLDEAALRAVRKARFRPHVEGGEPIAAWTTVPIVFALETT